MKSTVPSISLKTIMSVYYPHTGVKNRQFRFILIEKMQRRKILYSSLNKSRRDYAFLPKINLKEETTR